MARRKSRTSKVSRRGKRSRNSRVQKRSRTSRVQRRGKRSRTSRVQKRSRVSKVSRRGKRARTLRGGGAREEVIRAVQAFKVRDVNMGAVENWRLAKELAKALKNLYGEWSEYRENDEVGSHYLSAEYFHQSLSDTPQGTRTALKERIREAYSNQEWLFILIDAN